MITDEFKASAAWADHVINDQQYRIKRCEKAIEYLCGCLQKYGVDSRDMKFIGEYIRGEIEGTDEPLP